MRGGIFMMEGNGHVRLGTVVILGFGLLLAACGHAVQTTSGLEYLARQEMPMTAGGQASAQEFQALLMSAVAVEPVLKFPARIGIARIDNQTLAAIPAEEGNAWVTLSQKLGTGFGEFVPLNPLVAEMTAQNPVPNQRSPYLNVMNKIRLGAARQHLDAVLVYTTQTKSELSKNMLSLGDLTILGGFFLPSRTAQYEGLATGVLIDVMQGYPYLSLQSTLSASDLQTAFGRTDRDMAMQAAVKSSAAIKLAGEVEKAFLKLKLEMAEKGAELGAVATSAPSIGLGKPPATAAKLGG